MRTTILACMAAAALLAGCRKGGEEAAPSGEGFLCTAQRQGGDSKTGLDSDGLTVVWKKDTDKIRVYDADADDGTPHTLTAREDGNRSYFTEEGFAPDGGHRYCAYYPASRVQESALLEGGDGGARTLAVSLPATQTYAVNSFDDGFNPMAAVNDEYTLDFKNLCGVLRLELTGWNKVRKIVVTSNNENDHLWGNGTVSFDEGGEPSLGTLSGGNSVTLNCNDKLLDATIPTWFYIVLPANTLAYGFTMEVHCLENDNSTVSVFLTKTTNNSANEIELNTITMMRSVEVPPQDLSSKEASKCANCYIVGFPGEYRFRCDVKGNGVNTDGTNTNTQISGVNSVEVLWETVNTGTPPGKGAVVKSASLSEDKKYVYLYVEGDEAGGGVTPGNASIAVKNGSTILWSWHIWCVAASEVPGPCNNSQEANILMDRNLGALSSDASSGNASYGLMYQWGRKDPFMGAAARTGTALMAYTPSNAFPTPRTGSTIEAAILAPTTFMKRSGTYSPNWLSMPNDKLWNSDGGNKKTMYDPCPAGWRVPIGGSSNKNPWGQKRGYNNTQGTSYVWAWKSGYATLHGVSTGFVDSQVPASGGRIYSNSDELSAVGSYGYYWSATPDEEGGACGLYFSSSDVNPSNVNYRFCGVPVRPVQESSSSSK